MDQPTGGANLKPKASTPRAAWNASGMWLLLILMLSLTFFYFVANGAAPKLVTYDFFRKQLKANNIAQVEFSDHEVIGKFKELPDVKAEKAEKAEKADAKPGSAGALDFRVVLPPLVGDDLDKELLAKDVKYEAARPTDSTAMVLVVYMVVTVLLVASVWMMFRRARDQFMGGGILSGFAKSPAKRYETNNKPITFADVAGLEGVKNDLQEVVEFLKNPAKFQRLGGRVPKGVLLMGPPGTGKTLLARAVAGEAGVPFFSISGSEFIQMFVGVGASRVRDMFKTAKEASPAILFVDEIDAVGRIRGAGLGGGHDEREQTLNQILSEMDGFSQTESVIVLAATNRPDVLDPALLRPGRFDRHITVDRPTQKGRVAIFKVHVRDIPLADDVDLDRLAAGTVGLTGADIRNLVNEAALWATRQGKDKVDMDDFEHARDKVLMGAKREEVLTGKEKQLTAYHEAGHALLAWLIPGADRVHKVTIIPRGRSLGVTQLLPEEDRLNINENDLHARLVFILGGRAAEKLIFDQYSGTARERPHPGDQARSADGNGLGHERAARAGRLSHERRASVSGQGISRAARIQRAYGPTDRRRGFAHSQRCGPSRERAVGRKPRQAAQHG